MKVLLAVSGGIDSMYMLHRAPELFPGASFAVAHCNFCLRGDESDGDEAFVREACTELGVECFVKRFDTAGYASTNGVSVEMAARELRYAWFRELCNSFGFDTLATAHNANDNAETLILNLLRGTGTKGLRGIPTSAPGPCSANPLTISHIPSGLWENLPEIRKQGAGNQPLPFEGEEGRQSAGGMEADGVSDVAEAGRGTQNRLRPRNREWEGPAPKGVGGMDLEKRPVDAFPNPVLRTSSCVAESETPSASIPPAVSRPLLDISREEIRKWMTDNGYQWREDRTNGENEARRNKIRNQVFPVFGEINPSFVRTLREDMERIRQTDDIAEDYYQEAAERIVKYAPEAAAGAILEIKVKGLLELKHWRYVLWRILEDYGFSAPTFDKLCALLERYRTEPSGTVTLSGKTFEAPQHLLLAKRKSILVTKRS